MACGWLFHSTGENSAPPATELMLRKVYNSTNSDTRPERPKLVVLELGALPLIALYHKVMKRNKCSGQISVTLLCYVIRHTVVQQRNFHRNKENNAIVFVLLCPHIL